MATVGGSAAGTSRNRNAFEPSNVPLRSPMSPNSQSRFRRFNALECRICEEIFALQGEKVPRLLTCGHSVCHECLGKIQRHGTYIQCPFDRVPTELGDSGIWGLKKNFALLELLERLQLNKSLISSPELINDETSTAVKCDEDDSHIADIYCTVCLTNLCEKCVTDTHSSRTLSLHRRVPISQKPKVNPPCSLHQSHILEFACLEESCRNDSLMCYICKDYGSHKGHKHVLIENEADNVRSSITNAVQHVKTFSEEVEEFSRKLADQTEKIEGTGAVVESSTEGEIIARTNTGTAEKARLRVYQYFNDLRETINQQESEALSTINNYVRERLCSLRQQQEDMAVLISQISNVCSECDKALRRSDAEVGRFVTFSRKKVLHKTLTSKIRFCAIFTKHLSDEGFLEKGISQDVDVKNQVIQARSNIVKLLDTVQQQQQLFIDLAELCKEDTDISFAFTKDNRVHIGPKMEMRVVALGLDNGGKTSILFKLKQNEFVSPITTIGFNVETVEHKNVKFTIWDVGGVQKLRPLWRHYYLNTQAVIFVIDSTSSERLCEAHDELAKLVAEKRLNDALLLIYANKQDLPNAIPRDELCERIGIHRLCSGRSWTLIGCSAHTGDGLQEGLDWMARQLLSEFDS